MMEISTKNQNAILDRIDEIEQTELTADLNAFGCSTITGLLSPDQCEDIARLYPESDPFRSHIHMARHGFGKGEYKYFCYPLPAAIAALRQALYPKLVPVANAWNERMGIDTRFPQKHAEYLQQCHAAGQLRPTPLLLQYVKDDFNCLHQDVYGDLLFPLQVAVLLSRPEQDFTGGEFVLTEQRPACKAVPRLFR
jgi:uncharacterized protein